MRTAVVLMLGLIGAAAQADWTRDSYMQRQTWAMEDQARAMQTQAHELQMMRLTESVEKKDCEGEKAIVRSAAVNASIKQDREKAEALVMIEGLTRKQQEEIAKIMGFTL
jgi:hypothetical protein